MDKFKIVWRQVKVFLKKHWLPVSGAGAFILLLIMFMPIFRSSWLYFPESLRAKIALRKIAESTEKMYYCREDCQAKRLLYQNIIGGALSSKTDEILPDLEAVILNKNVLAETREQLIGLWQGANLPVSGNLKNFCADSLQDFQLRAQLINSWPELNSSSFDSELVGNFKTAKSENEQVAALSLLADKDSPLVISTIWQIILGNYQVKVKEQAFFLLANLSNKPEVYWPENISNLRLVLEGDSFPTPLKDKAILALGDYYDLYPQETESLLVDVVNQPESFNDYQRSFAIDILNNNRELKVASLNLSLEDWSAYYNN